jgi:ABC-type molybdate transport system substrate-binding protein
VQPKVVYAANINIAREYVKAGSADAALTAWSLVLREPNVVLVDSGLHSPLDQAIAVVLQSPRIAQARRFVRFVLGPAAQQMFSDSGYETPSR